MRTYRLSLKILLKKNCGSFTEKDNPTDNVKHKEFVALIGKRIDAFIKIKAIDSEIFYQSCNQAKTNKQGTEAQQFGVDLILATKDFGSFKKLMLEEKNRAS